MVQFKSKNQMERLLKYRWGVAGILIAACAVAWYLSTISEQHLNSVSPSAVRSRIKVNCRECDNDPARRPSCNTCGGAGFVWLNAAPRSTTPKPAATTKSPQK